MKLSGKSWKFKFFMRVSILLRTNAGVPNTCKSNESTCASLVNGGERYNTWVTCAHQDNIETDAKTA